MSTITVNSGGNLQTALNSAVPGDFVELQAGATWDGTFTLPNAGASTGNPITVRSQNYASLPSGRVSPSNASNMPRIRTVSSAGDGAFKTAANASGWVLDGLEITDDAGTNVVQALLDFGLSFGGSHHNTVQRCWIHQKETGTNYERSVTRGIWNEGSNCVFKWNYVGPFIGYYYGQLNGTPIQTHAYMNVGQSVGNLVEDNFLDAWYASLFTGGSDPAPTHTSAMSAATTTQATLSDVTGITAGVMLRFELHFTATVASTGAQTATLTRTAGAVLVSPGDVAVIASDIYRGAIVFPTSGSTAVADITNISGNVYTVLYATSSTKPADGSWPCVMYKTALVDTVNSGTGVVTYTPYETGYSALNQNPDLSNVAWCALGEGNTADMIIRRNTIHIDAAFEVYNLVNGNHSGPKGYFEFKSAYNMLMDGNYFLGGTATMGISGNNQNGTSPWPTIQNLTISNNWFAPDYISSDYVAQAFIITINPYKTTAPGKNVLVTNNFFKNISVLGAIQRYDGFEISHNTIINNTGSSGGAYNALMAGVSATTNYSFKDNIGFYSNGGHSCQFPPNTLATCWPSGMFLNNVVVDNTAQGFGTSVWGTGSVLSPIPTTIGGIGFTDEPNGIYSLAPSSNYYHAGTGSSDPGVDWDALLIALGATEPSTDVVAVVSGRVTISGRVVIA